MFVALDKVFTLENILFFGKGALISLGMAFVALVLGLVLGILGASAKRSRFFVFRLLGNLYVEIIRGTPMLLQILIIFSVIPSIYTAITGEVLRINVFLIGIIALSINSGAYSTELIRSGINGVDKGQWEACETLGLSSWQMMKLVILPQAFKLIIPPVISEFITLVKDSSLTSCIGAIELLKASQIVGNQFYDYMSAYLLAAIFYLIMTISISFIGKKIEKRLAESD